MKSSRTQIRASLVITIVIALAIASSHMRADTGACGGANTTVPFLDIAGNQFFCQIAEAYFSGLTNGTTATTYSPHDPVPREQMAAFITRTLDQSLRRGNRRAALNRWYTSPPDYTELVGTTSIDGEPRDVVCDGADLWTANYQSNTVSRVRASDGRFLESYSGIPSPVRILSALGRVFVISMTSNQLYMIDPNEGISNATQVATLGGANPKDLAFDGSRIWTVNQNPATISIVTPKAHAPWPVINTPGGIAPEMIVFDGANMLYGDSQQGGSLHRLDNNGFVFANIQLGSNPSGAVFDGTNLWVRSESAKKIFVVRDSSGAVLETLTDGFVPDQIAFDGERMLVTHHSENKIALWHAASLTYLGGFDVVYGPRGVCSDGANFWITLYASGDLARF